MRHACVRILRLFGWYQQGFMEMLGCIEFGSMQRRLPMFTPRLTDQLSNSPSRAIGRPGICFPLLGRMYTSTKFLILAQHWDVLIGQRGLLSAMAESWHSVDTYNNIASAKLIDKLILPSVDRCLCYACQEFLGTCVFRWPCGIFCLLRHGICY